MKRNPSKCTHGNGRNCAICFHPEGACDFGTCHQPAAYLVDYTYERRPMCARHANFVAGLDFSFIAGVEPIAGK